MQAFSAKSKYPAILRGLASGSEAKREKARKAISELEEDPSDWTPNFAVSERDALALLEAIALLRLPKPQFEWSDPIDELVFSLVKSPHPALVPVAERVALLESVSERARCGLLTLLSAIGTREAAAAFVRVVRTRGWPKSYSRLFRELPKILCHADVTLPDLVELAGDHLSSVLHAIVATANAKGANTRSIAERLGPVAPLLRKRLASGVSKAQKRKSMKPGWRFTDSYQLVQSELCGLLDLASFIEDAELVHGAKAALALPDPRVAAHAALFMLRAGRPVPKKIWRDVAACDDTRSLLFERLQAMQKLALFPREFRTWDAFAKAEMVSWLTHPCELGREPDAIEQMAVLSHRTSGKRPDVYKLYVWRFREGKPWKAGISGPYVTRGTPRPLWGRFTFSRFDAWEEKTPEEHADAIVETLGESGVI